MLFVHAMRIVQEPTLGHGVNTPSASNFSILAFQPFQPRMGIKGISLHSYRYAWAERAKTAGYPERFAQEALGHNSKAVHRACARKAKVELPQDTRSTERNTASLRPAFAVALSGFRAHVHILHVSV